MYKGASNGPIVNYKSRLDGKVYRSAGLYRSNAMRDRTTQRSFEARIGSIVLGQVEKADLTCSNGLDFLSVRGATTRGSNVGLET
jgi:hypothetical protein